MEYLISMFIDNELSLDEKQVFVEQVAGDPSYKDETLDLLQQEKMLAGMLNKEAPEVELKAPRAKILPFVRRSMGWAVAACLVLVISFQIRPDWFTTVTDHQAIAEPTTVMHRFVLYHQGTSPVQISGSFTNWQAIPLVPAGHSGYWEVSLELPPGEHRYSFIVDGTNHIPDPTVATQESDDFGSSNSILNIKV